jgi:hypothetical protein
MDLDDPDVVAVADAPEGPDEVARLDRAAGAGREHQPGFRPGGAHVSTVRSLRVLLELERVAHEVEQRQLSFASGRLDGRLEQLTSDALELLADLDRPGVEVNVFPTQAECFTTAQAVKDEQHERGVQRVGLGSRASSYLARFWGLRQDKALKLLYATEGSDALLSDPSPLVTASVEMAPRLTRKSYSFHSVLAQATFAHHLGLATGELDDQLAPSITDRQSALMVRSGIRAC